MKIALKIAYLGTNYCGWQKQKNLVSVAETIENAFSEKFNEQINLVGSGRTDAGVHALNQIAHFETNLKIKAEKIAIALNTVLPNDIKILESSEVPSDFHARFSAKSKTYEYYVYTSKTENVFLVNRALQIKQDLNLSNMQKCANKLIGEHDFKAFCKQKSSEKDCVRTIYNIQITQEKEFNLIKFQISGNGFLHNMVRILVSTLIEAGKGNLSAQDIQNILNNKSRIKAPRTLPPYALYLKEVKY